MDSLKYQEWIPQSHRCRCLSSGHGPSKVVDTPKSDQLASGGASHGHPVVPDTIGYYLPVHPRASHTMNGRRLLEGLTGGSSVLLPRLFVGRVFEPRKALV